MTGKKRTEIILIKKWRTPEESRLVGNFGEYALAYFLTKKSINIMRVDTVFFDLIVKDKQGHVFPKDKIIGISVKLRDRTGTTSSCTIEHKDFKKIENYGKKWNIEPYICHMIIHQKKSDRILEGFIFSHKDAGKYFAKGKRKYAISFSKLRKKIDNDFINRRNYFRWIL